VIKRYKDGTIKDFSVPSAHTLYVEVACFTKTPNERGTFDTNRRVLKRDAYVMPSLDTLDKLHQIRDLDDGFILGQKWNITPKVVQDLKSKGEAESMQRSPYLVFNYFIRKTLHADDLRHKG